MYANLDLGALVSYCLSAIDLAHYIIQHGTDTDSSFVDDAELRE